MLGGIARFSGMLKNYHGFGKKLSQEQKTFVSPKSHQWVPAYRGPIDAILGGGPNILFEIIFFRRKNSQKRPKSAIFSLFLQYQYIVENTKSDLNVFVCIDFA